MKDNYTNGAPYLITQVETAGEYSKRIHYLFPDGSRRGVVISQADDAPGLRDRLGRAWAEGRTNLVKGQRP